jgi:hypothetical protein
MTIPSNRTSPGTTARPTTATAAGELRQTLRQVGWRADLAWADVGSRSAGAAVRAAGGGAVRRTIAYVPALKTLDGGALRLWKNGDVAVPLVADVREVMIAIEGSDEWTSEVFEAPPSRVEASAGDEARAPVAA